MFGLLLAILASPLLEKPANATRHVQVSPLSPLPADDQNLEETELPAVEPVDDAPGEALEQDQPTVVELEDAQPAGEAAHPAAPATAADLPLGEPLEAETSLILVGLVLVGLVLLPIAIALNRRE